MCKQARESNINREMNKSTNRKSRERSKVYNVHNWDVHSGDHLARFVWHRDPAITADQTRLQRSHEPHTTVRKWVVMGDCRVPSSFFRAVLACSLACLCVFLVCASKKTEKKRSSELQSPKLLIHIEMKYYRTHRRWDTNDHLEQKEHNLHLKETKLRTASFTSTYHILWKFLSQHFQNHWKRWPEVNLKK